MTITDGKEDATDGSSQPKIIVGSYNIEPSPVMAGEAFTAKITLTNTSKTDSVGNMVVTASCDSPHIALQNESNAIFVGSLGEGQEYGDRAIIQNRSGHASAAVYDISSPSSMRMQAGRGFSSTGTVSLFQWASPCGWRWRCPRSPRRSTRGIRCPCPSR